ncbi:hypothetical protein GCM10009133_02240 [Cocleimonas flava]|jgi:hypothetical protein|uniref:Beta/gamma crystallin n=1 Tax=Cocleimonas flava TaxID=634765 RepID=A0A4V2P8C3_9GAMM|nr:MULTISPECIES: hypothetical protein [Cocleimonas]MEB8433548.1 hypothetical protein [Cocleimonas sp. KMM 6892]MEC4716359.1 hypothetical protein [Cocleimonas sp. KMM 6895]MEC4745748.1 hypothetical protein [Cocleimonas sp. KMM 6896]TCJ85195.1 hypothetical protein EV695_3162 [Cocleimonas flava]
MTISKMGLIIATAVLISACSGGSDSSSTASGSKPEKKMAAKPAKPAATKPRGSKITGTIRPGSKFSKIKLGMSMARVNSTIGGPNDLKRHETGKRWIPFYYGSDVQRMQALYDGEGCLTYNGGNVFGGGGNKLIGINVDPSGACY